LVSGRRLDTLDRLFQPLRPPAAGLHGVERRAADGTVTRSPLPPDALDPLRTRLARVVEEIEGLLLEDKGQALAVHYRRAPARERDARLLVAEAARELGSEFELLEGKKVLEVRPRGTGKDKVVDAFMAEPPFAGRTPVFIGDDRTDEDGFAAVNRLGGHSIRVGGEGESAARYRVGDASALRDWLAGVAGALESLTHGSSA
jgi:trehalose 6-phosphate phosphatase